MRLARIGIILGLVVVFLVASAGWILFRSPELLRGLQQQSADATLAAYRQAIDSARDTAFTRGLTQDDWAQANKVLVAGLADPLFSRLNKSEQAGVYAGAGWAAMRLDQDARARQMLTQAVKLNPDDSESWRILAKTHAYLDDYDAAAKTLITYAQRWPSRLDSEADFVIEMIDAVEADSAVRQELLQALYNAKWNPEPVGVTGMWKELALRKIQDGQREAARSIITHITAPADLIAVRSDKRFDGLFDPKAPQFNVEAAAVRRADLLRTYADSNPKDLQPEAKLVRALMALGRNEEAVDRAARTLTRAAYGDGPFKHLDDKLWLMDSRSQALARMGRFQEALAQLQQAAKPDGKGEAYADQVLNLGSFYCNLGRAEDSLAAARSATDLNDYGRGVQAYEQHCAALLKHDTALAERMLAFLREHKKDNEAPLLFALLRGNHMDEAAKSVIDRLAAADSRSDMLVQMQDYLETKRLPRSEIVFARWVALVARDDVRRAVERVGRIEHYEYYGE